jgi:hypothetical protein
MGTLRRVCSGSLRPRRAFRGPRSRLRRSCWLRRGTRCACLSTQAILLRLRRATLGGRPPFLLGIALRSRLHCQGYVRICHCKNCSFLTRSAAVQGSKSIGWRPINQLLVERKGSESHCYRIHRHNMHRVEHRHFHGNDTADRARSRGVRRRVAAQLHRHFRLRRCGWQSACL